MDLGRKVEQFKRALSQPLDELSRIRLADALDAILANAPQCNDDLSGESEVVDLNLVRIDKALDQFSIAEVRDLVREVEAEMLKPKE